MVFDRVEIWRGVILTENDIEQLKIEMNTPDDDVWELIEELNYHLYKDAQLDKKVHFIKMGPCCSDNNSILFGIQLTEYERSPFDWKDVKEENLAIMTKMRAERKVNNKVCGKRLSSSERYCGNWECCD